MEKLIETIIKWGNEKGINNPQSQFRKLNEETLEAYEEYICVSYGLSDHYNLSLELGDIGVVWILLCEMLGEDPYKALEAAHNKNKNRKGKTINGNFIKEEDLIDGNKEGKV